MPGGRLVERIDQLNVRVVEVPAAAVANARSRWARLAEVVSVETDGVVSVDWIPPDPLWAKQWEQRQVRAQRAWDLERGDRTTIVAVVDTGVQLNHPDLAVRLVPGRDFVNNDGRPADDNGHGTSVAGVIAATANSIGVTGMCNRCRIMPVKALAANGTGLWTVAAKGIIWAADHGADVINLSFGGPTGGDILQNAIRYARDKGAVVVGSAGNYGTTAPFYPGAFPEVLSVAASTSVRPALRLVELLDLLGRGGRSGLHLELRVALHVRRLLRDQRGGADGLGHRGPGALGAPGHDALAGRVDPEGGHRRRCPSRSPASAASTPTRRSTGPCTATSRAARRSSHRLRCWIRRQEVTLLAGDHAGYRFDADGAILRGAGLQHRCHDLRPHLEAQHHPGPQRLLVPARGRRPGRLLGRRVVQVFLTPAATPTPTPTASPSP